MFAIDAQYGKPMRWQRDAPGMRDLMARAGFNCKVGTDASYQGSQGSLRRLCKTWCAATLRLRHRAACPTPIWAKVADRPPLMKRLEHAQQQGLAVLDGQRRASLRGKPTAATRSTTYRGAGRSDRPRGL